MQIKKKKRKKEKKRHRVIRRERSPVRGKKKKKKGIPEGGDIRTPACRGWCWWGGQSPGWCRTRSLLCLRREQHSQLSNDSWARAADGITALGEKLITDMNQPCFFLLSSALSPAGGGQGPSLEVQEIILREGGEHEASHFSPGPSRYLCLESTGEFTALQRKRIPSGWQAGRGTVSGAKWLLGFHTGCDPRAGFHFSKLHPHPCSEAPTRLSCTWVGNPIMAKGSVLLSPIPGRSP